MASCWRSAAVACVHSPHFLMDDSHHEVELAEDALRAAMLASDVEKLDALLEDDLLFVGPDGGVLSKAEDLGFHRSGVQRMTAIDFQERQFRVGPVVASVSALAFVAGVFKGHSFQGRFRYRRVWHRTPAGWKLVAGSVAKLESPQPSSI